MAYKIQKFQNVSGWDDNNGPEISINVDDPGWDEALEAWKQGKPPTKSPLWKRGVFAIFVLDNG